MNGRALSEEEIGEIAEDAGNGIHITPEEGRNLIATIRDRDKTIAELQDSTHYAIGRAVHRLQQQNTILREALEQIEKVEKCCACDDDLGVVQIIASEALAKVKEI